MWAALFIEAQSSPAADGSGLQRSIFQAKGFMGLRPMLVWNAPWRYPQGCPLSS